MSTHFRETDAAETFIASADSRRTSAEIMEAIANLANRKSAKMTEDRKCKCCGVSEQFEMLAYRDADLVCQDCDDSMEREWVAESPQERRHYLDTFTPG